MDETLSPGEENPRLEGESKVLSPTDISEAIQEPLGSGMLLLPGFISTTQGRVARVGGHNLVLNSMGRREPNASGNSANAKRSIHLA